MGKLNSEVYMSKIFDQIKTLFNAFPEAVLILDRDFKLIWKNSNASFDLLADQGTLKELKVLTSGQISKAVIPTSHGMKNVCISPLQ